MSPRAHYSRFQWLRGGPARGGAMRLLRLQTYLSFCDRPGRLLAVSLSAAVAFTALTLAIPVGIRFVFARVVPLRQPGLLVLAGGALLLLYLLQTGAQVGGRILILNATKRATTRLREALVAKLYAVSRDYYLRADRGHLHSAVVQDTERADIMVNALAAEVLPSVMSAALLGVVLVGIDWRLFLILVAIAGPAGLALRTLMAPAVRARIGAFHLSFERFSRGIYRVLELMDLTRTQAAEGWEAERQSAIAREFAGAARGMAVLDTAYRSLQQMLVAFSGVVVLIIGGAFIAQTAITTGDLVAFYLAVVMLKNSVTVLTSRYTQVMEGRAALRRVDELLAVTEYAPYQGGGALKAPECVAVRDVSFGYNGPDLFREVTLDIDAGRTVAITGPNGSGKTTLLHLVLGFYEPASGAVAVNGMQYAEVEMRSFRRGLGVVAQDPVLFAGTVRENVTYGCPEATEQEIVEAACLATAHEFVCTLPDGYDTMIGEGGVLLSGGQRQRLAITRALIGRPRILILDEPTNHLDADGIERVLNNLLALPSRPAVVMISHDPSIVRRADRVYVLKAGKLERG